MTQIQVPAPGRPAQAVPFVYHVEVPPPAWPVAVWTLLLGLFGALSAARRAGVARTAGAPTGRYWAVFFGTFVPVAAVWAVLGSAVLIPAFVDYRRAAMVRNLESSIVAGSGAQGITLTSATCEVITMSTTDGSGTFRCAVTAEGKNATLDVTARSDGTWTADAVN
jgi:hypothetical protein